MTTSVGAPVTWITVTAKCRFCGKPGTRVRGIAGTIVLFTCSSRRCGEETEFIIG